MDSGMRHWDDSYTARGSTGVSWYEHAPKVSLEIVSGLGVSRRAAIVDVGGGASHLADDLVASGYLDVTVLDLSAVALGEVEARTGGAVTVLCEDLLSWKPARRYEVWHDRAVFHFFVDGHSRQAYIDVLDDALRSAGTPSSASSRRKDPTTAPGFPSRGTQQQIS